MYDRIFRKITELLAKGETFAVATIIKAEGSTPRGAGAKMIIHTDGATFGTIGGDCAEAAVVSEALEAIRLDRPRTVSLSLEEEEKGGIGMRCGGRIEVSIEVVKPAPKLVIIGAGHIAFHIARFGRAIGFSVTVIDPFASEQKFPESVEVIPERVDAGLSKVEITPQTYVVIVTRHKYDEPALKAVLDSKAAYIGMVGSKNRVNAIYQILVKEGISKEKLRRIYAPIGLDIGAETPAEIAVSIIAEIIKTRKGGSGKSLKLERIEVSD